MREFSDTLAQGHWEAFLWAMTKKGTFGFLAILVRSTTGRLFALYDEFYSEGRTGYSQSAELIDVTMEQALDEIETAMKTQLAPLCPTVHRVVVNGDAKKAEELLRGTPLSPMIYRARRAVAS